MFTEFTPSEIRAINKAKKILKSRIINGCALTNSELTSDYLQLHFAGIPHEIFACVMLDNQHRVIDIVELFRGTIDGCAVYPREVVKSCLQYNAAAVIFTHNHPSGTPDPSQADIAITRRLKTALQTVDIRVLDHVVIGDTDTTSFATRGLI